MAVSTKTKATTSKGDGMAPPMEAPVAEPMMMMESAPAPAAISVLKPEGLIDNKVATGLTKEITTSEVKITSERYKAPVVTVEEGGSAGAIKSKASSPKSVSMSLNQ